MNLPKSVVQILEMVEKTSEKPVKIVETPHLHGGFAKSRAATQDMPESIIFLNSQYKDYYDYLVAHEALHIARFFSVPSEQRRYFHSTNLMIAQAVEQLFSENTELLQVPDFDKVIPFLMMCAENILNAVNSMPQDFIVDQYVYQNCPEVKNSQTAILDHLHGIIMRSVKHPSFNHNPPTISGRVLVFNHVFFEIINSIIKSDYQIPLEQGLQLPADQLKQKTLQQLQSAQDHVDDRLLINLWGTHFKVRHWFDWIEPDHVTTEHFSNK